LEAGYDATVSAQLGTATGDRENPDMQEQSQIGEKNTRDRVRQIIRSEIARAHPIDDARGPLELIVESSVRYSSTDSGLMITVVDEQGQPRTIMKDGDTAGFTLRDLVEELRRKHPALFRPHPPEVYDHPSSPEPVSTLTSAQHLGSRLQDQADDPPHGRVGRDWLIVADANSAEVPKRPASEPIADIFRHGWTHLLKNSALLWEHQKPRAGSLRSGRRAIHLALTTLGSKLESLPRPWISAHRPLLLGSAAAALLLLAGLFAAMEVPWSGRETSNDIAAVAATGSDPDRTGSVAAPEAQAPNGGTLRGVPEVLDTSTLWLDDKVVRLFGVEWARGAGEPDELTRYLGGREVVCEAVLSSDTYRCKVGEQDLSRVVLYNGGGRATSEATPDLKAAEAHARSARLGIWRK